MMERANLDLGRARIALWPATLLSVVAAALFVFVELAEEVGEGETEALDRMIFLAFRHADDWNDPLGPPWLEEAAVEITALGGYPVIVLLAALVIGYLAISKRGWAALYVFVCVAGGALISSVLKVLFARPRPDLVKTLDVIHTASFPSGHAMASAVMYLTLASLSARFLPTWRERIYVLAAAAFFAGLVGVSRIYLGVHWPSDVLAGWLLGIAWAGFVWTVATVIDRSRGLADLGRHIRASLRRGVGPSQE